MATFWAMLTHLREKPLNEVEELVFRLCEAGQLTRREIARQLDVSPTRVQQIHAAASIKLKDFAEHGEDALSLLPSRVRRVVVDLEIPSRTLARSAIVSGRLSCSEGMGAIFWDGVMLRQVSRKTWAVLYEWAGRPPLPCSEPPWRLGG